MRLLYFNPENDLALAANDPHYTPPASALQMATDLQCLPYLWADTGDLILLRDGSFINAQGDSSLFTLHSSFSSLLPWGWSPLTIRQLRDIGTPSDLLPTDAQMATYRNASSRQTVVWLLRRLQQLIAPRFEDGSLIGESAWCATLDEVCQTHSRFGQSMMKAPWSGSGRGVHPVRGPLTEKDLAWLQRTLQKQGGVEVEPLYMNKVQDLAMEFWAERGQVRYEGLSLFTTTEGGVYSGNLVASESEKECMLSQYVSVTLLHEVRHALEKILSSDCIPEWYTGPLGVDMMLCQPHTSPIKESSIFRSAPCDASRLKDFQSSISLHPFIELNLRMTMGWVALQLSKRLSPHETRLFRILQEGGRYHYELNDMSE